MAHIELDQYRVRFEMTKRLGEAYLLLQTLQCYCRAKRI